MPEIGYSLSSEEFGPRDLIRFAGLAEERGFEFAVISDHFHPWIDAQGHSPFVWSVIGGVAQATSRLRLGTGVTCPTVRIHPAIVAQAAATSAAMMPGRFFLGVGSGENLNEHVVGEGWPPADQRLAMLEEAIEIIRRLWTGKNTSVSGSYFEVENARIYTLPDELPPILVAAAGTKAAELAGRAGDGLVATSPKAEVLEAWRRAGGEGKPAYGQITVCWARDERTARRTAFERWPNSAIAGELGQELPLPRHFEQAASMLTEDQVADSMPVGPDPERFVRAIEEYLDAGFTHVYLHQVGPDQEDFVEFCSKEILPKVGRARAA
jgi:G6PDH family F420-dependent oxidoreductase